MPEYWASPEMLSLWVSRAGISGKEISNPPPSLKNLCFPVFCLFAVAAARRTNALVGLPRNRAASWFWGRPSRLQAFEGEWEPDQEAPISCIVDDDDDDGNIYLLLWLPGSALSVLFFQFLSCFQRF